MRGGGDRAQRPAQRGGDKPAAGEREAEQGERGGQPFDTEFRLEALARQHDPVVVVVDAEAHPEALDLVARIGEVGLLTQGLPDFFRNQVEQRFVGQRLQHLAAGERREADSFALVQLDQQAAPQHRVGVDQRGTRQVDDAGGLLREFARARLALVDAVELDGARRGSEDQQRDQQKGPREQTHNGITRSRNHASRGPPSGTNT